MILAEMAELFEKVDAVVMPTTAMEAPAYDLILDPDTGIDALIDRLFTSYWDCLNSPVLAVPMGFGINGLPLSMQIAGRPFEEATVLRIGDAYQGMSDWHRQVPPLTSALKVASPIIPTRSPVSPIERTRRTPMPPPVR